MHPGRRYAGGSATARGGCIRQIGSVRRNTEETLTPRARLDSFPNYDDLRRRVLLGAAASIILVTILGLPRDARLQPAVLYHFGVVMMRIARNITVCSLLSLLTLAAASCSPAGAVTVLLDETTECILSQDPDGSNMSCTAQLSFTPTAANQMIRVTVTATLADSRPAFTIFDANDNPVVQVPAPTVSNASATFTADSTAAHVVFIDESGNADSEYRVLVEVL